MGPKWRMHCVQTHDLPKAAIAAGPRARRKSERRAKPLPQRTYVCVRARQMIAGQPNCLL